MTALAFLSGLLCGVALGYVWARRVWRGAAERMAAAQSRLIQRTEPRGVVVAFQSRRRS